jgi:hypothetical protein
MNDDPLYDVSSWVWNLWADIMKITVEVDRTNRQAPGAFSPELVDKVWHLKGKIEELKTLVEGLM